MHALLRFETVPWLRMHTMDLISQSTVRAVIPWPDIGETKWFIWQNISVRQLEPFHTAVALVPEQQLSKEGSPPRYPACIAPSDLPTWRVQAIEHLSNTDGCRYSVGTACSDLKNWQMQGTEHLFNKEMIAKMPKGSYLVNTARGKICEANAVADALEAGHLRGYAGDVWYPQPAPKDHPWRTMPKHAMTPHYSGTTLDAQVGSCTKSHLPVGLYVVRSLASYQAILGF